MVRSGYGRRIGTYGGQVALTSELDNASPHRVVQMLFAGAIKQLARARGAIERGETARKGESLGKAIGIVEYLKSILNSDAGEVAQNLDALYEYALERLSHANVKNDADVVAEVASLLSTIKEGWDGIADSVEAKTQSAEGHLALVSGSV